MIRKAWNYSDVQGNDYVDKKEIPYIMRFLLQYPSEAQVSNIILVQLEEEEPSDFIRYQKFEPYMLNIMMKKEYEPAAPEQLHQAFRVLDPQLKGYIELDVMRELMLHKGIGFRDPQEIDPFLSYAVDKTGKRIEYEDYISKKMDEQERHLEGYLKQWENFNKD